LKLVSSLLSTTFVSSLLSTTFGRKPHPAVADVGAVVVALDHAHRHPEVDAEAGERLLGERADPYAVGRVDVAGDRDRHAGRLSRRPARAPPKSWETLGNLGPAGVAETS
jgi:hypothetical protein